MQQVVYGACLVLAPLQFGIAGGAVGKASPLALVMRQVSREKTDSSVYEARLGVAKVEVLSDTGSSGGVWMWECSEEWEELV